MTVYQIGKVSERLGLTVDTLRYYEKIGLLPPVSRNISGLRVYNDKDISRLQFIQRAQKMNFTLFEIGELLKVREKPQKARSKAQDITRQKLNEIEVHLADLKALRRELQLLLTLCSKNTGACPIIENFGNSGSLSKRRSSQGKTTKRP